MHRLLLQHLLFTPLLRNICILVVKEEVPLNCRTFYKKFQPLSPGEAGCAHHSQCSSSTSIPPRPAPMLSSLSNCLPSPSGLCHFPPVCYLSFLSCSSLPGGITHFWMSVHNRLAFIVIPSKECKDFFHNQAYPALCYLQLFSPFRIYFLLSLGPNTFIFPLF